MEERDTVFIPLSIEKIDYKESYFFDGTKSAILIVSAVLLGLLWFYLASLTGTAIGLVFWFIVLLPIEVYIVRRFVFEEKKWKQIKSGLEENKNSNHKLFWGIDLITEEGLIKYEHSMFNEIKRSVIVRVINGSKKGLPPDFVFGYYNTIETFHKKLFLKGYKVERMIVPDEKQVPSNVKYLIEKANSHPDPSVRILAMEHVNNLAYIAKNYLSVDADYYIITCGDLAQTKFLLSTVKDIMKSVFSDSFFKEVTLLDKKGVYNFFEYILQISSFSSDSLSKVPSKQDITDYAEIVSVDKNGVTLSFDSYVESKEKSKVEELPVEVTDSESNKYFEVLREESIEPTVDLFDILSGETISEEPKPVVQTAVFEEDKVILPTEVKSQPKMSLIPAKPKNNPELSELLMEGE